MRRSAGSSSVTEALVLFASGSSGATLLCCLAGPALGRAFGSAARNAAARAARCGPNIMIWCLASLAAAQCSMLLSAGAYPPPPSSVAYA